jgi:hypothetical protein
MGVVVTTQEATKGVRDAMGRSRLGVCYLMVEMRQGEDEKWKGIVRQCLWNMRAGEIGLAGVEAGLRYLPTSEDGTVENELALNYKGKRLRSRNEMGAE